MFKAVFTMKGQVDNEDIRGLRVKERASVC